MTPSIPLSRRWRLRFSPSALIITLLVVGLIVATIWMGTAEPERARLELVALDASGRFTDALALRSAQVRSADPSRAGLAFPVLVGVRNRGGEIASPVSVDLSAPIRFRIWVSPDRPFERERDPGSALVHYRLPIQPTPVLPGAQPAALPGIDTLWIEPWLPDYYCVLAPSGVPEFAAVPQSDATGVSGLVVYYSFAVDDSRIRQTGLLRFALDTTAFTSTGSPALPVFEPEAIPDSVDRDDAAQTIAELTEQCAPPDQTLTLQVVRGLTADSGRVFDLRQDGQLRKRLFDRDRDSLIELEWWDADGDGRFDTRRQSRLPIPKWFPRPAPNDPDTTPAPPSTPASRTPAASPDRGAAPPGAATTDSSGVAIDTMVVDTTRTDTTVIDTTRTDTTVVDTTRTDTTVVDTMRSDTTVVDTMRSDTAVVEATLIGNRIRRVRGKLPEPGARL